ncbi:MAG: ABC transporter ATP-binding protein [Clostridia bacterium]|nr:ABC transporter ATP-binding protein [Clostridia bacterium]
MEKKKYAITVKNLHIKYKSIQKLSIRKSLFKLKKSKSEYFEAVKGISFNIEQGKIVGIIGKNGSGKSTTLRAIAGIFSADKGSIDLHGNTISLLSIGVGFQPKLTGYENIFLSGMLLGFTEEQIEEKIEDIIKFSELGKFIHKPVRTYSSGMYSKLAFSITAMLETQILLIDEVFSVGDIKFKQKSYNKMKELISKEDRTVVIVSHSMAAMKELCDEIIWLNDGVIMDQGKPEDIIPKYEEYMHNLD